MQRERIEIRVASELGALVPRFIANRNADVLQLEAALQRGDAETLRRIGHILKGAGGGYGFSEISRIGGEIEAGAVKGELNTLGAHVAALKRYLELVYVVFE